MSLNTSRDFFERKGGEMPAHNIHALTMHELISANLMYFQFIEEYIREYFRLLPASRSAEFKDIPKDTDTLGTLIRKFKKHNTNKELIKKLDEINKDRIRVVHKIWVDYSSDCSEAVKELKGSEPATKVQAIDEVASKYRSDLEILLPKAFGCLSSVADEHEKIRPKEVR